VGIVGNWDRNHVNIIPGDFNGDGKLDFIRQTDSTLGAWPRSTLQTATAPLPLPRGHGLARKLDRDHVTIIPGDFNGDGRTDFIKQTDSTMQGLATVYLSKVDGSFTTADMGSPLSWDRNHVSIILGDFMVTAGWILLSKPTTLQMTWESTFPTETALLPIRV